MANTQTRIERRTVDQWLRDNAPHLKTHIAPGGQRGYYRKDQGPAMSFVGKYEDGTTFQTWRDVFERLTFQG